jgi:FdhD protein
MSYTSPSTSCSIVRWDGAVARAASDELAAEEPLEIRVRGRAISVTMRTPGHDEELAGGFLLTEGIVRRREDILKVEHCGRNEEGNVVNVLLAPEVPVDFARLTRHVFASSSCGLCGKASIDAIRTRARWEARADPLRVAPSLLASLPPRIREAQKVFARTGGLHAAGLFDSSGALRCLREDVGRHNAVDKVVGWAATERLLPLRSHMLMVSGRASFELTQKALMAGIPMLVAVSAPSSLAVELAEDAGMTVVGFLRGETMNVYCGAERVVTPD